MKKISNYILEKLHVNKDYKGYLITEGDVIGFITIYGQPDWTTLLITTPRKVQKFDGNTIYYSDNGKFDPDLNLKNVELNSNGFYEAYASKMTYVCLPKEDMLNFLYDYQTLHKDLKKLFKHVYTNFLDEKHEIPTKGLSINNFQEPNDKLIRLYQRMK